MTPKAGLLVNTVPIEKQLIDTIAYTNDLHLRQTLEGRIRFGSDYSGADPGNDPKAVADDLFAKLQAAFKDGDEIEYDYYTVGYRPTPEDGFPILGETGVDGLTVAVMHSGVSNGAIVGELITKQVLTGEKDPILANFLLSRFSNASATDPTSNGTIPTGAPRPTTSEYTGAASHIGMASGFVGAAILAVLAF